MEQSNTSGPWRIKFQSFEQAWVVINSRNEPIAEIYADANQDEQREAATIISSAPDLLRALRYIQIRTADDADIQRVISSAIARAEGRA